MRPELPLPMPPPWSGGFSVRSVFVIDHRAGRRLRGGTAASESIRGRA